jgi:hypothetical protein
MNINNKIDPSPELKISDWELDFYSRPIIESNGKKKVGVNYLLYKKL